MIKSGNAAGIVANQFEVAITRPRIEPERMQQKIILDFAKLQEFSVEKQLVATLQVSRLCGLNKRISQRLKMAIKRVLTSFPPEQLHQNSISFVSIESGCSLKFSFLTRPIGLSELVQQQVAENTSSLRRLGEKVQDFQFSGTPTDGFHICFLQPLPIGCEIPTSAELKQWTRIVSTGDWETAFEKLCRTHVSAREMLARLQSGVASEQEQHRGEHRQSDAANSFMSLVATKTDNAVLIFDASGQVEWSNAAFQRLTRCDEKASATQSATALLARGQEPDSCEKFEKSLKRGETFLIEHAWKMDCVTEEDGTQSAARTAWVEFQVTPVRNGNNAAIRWIAIGSDVTRRRQAELAMQAARDIAESANKAKSEFLAMMSHEIRTPMNAIIGMTELALGTDLSIEQREYLATANNSAQSLLQILNDILDLSKVDAAKLQLEQTDFNLADLTRDTLSTLAVLAQTKQLNLRCEFPLEIPQQVIGDPFRLRQILVNLVGNAIKFTAVGEIAVAAELTDETIDRLTIHFSVRDTGVGIAEEKISRIFEAFYQTDASVTRDFGGTGLGLAITSELLRLMGGRIWVESKLGTGSTFHFVVTLPKSTRSLVGVPATTAKALDGKTILLVDGDTSNHAVVESWLKQWGVVTQFVTNAADARKFLFNEERKSFDAVIIDSVLTDADGFAVARELIESTVNKSIPVMMLSSDHRATTIKRCREFGIEDYLVKPLSPGMLSTTLQHALGRPVSRETVDDILGTSTEVALQKDRVALSEGVTPRDGVAPGIEKTLQPLEVLIVDDHPSNRTLICEILKRRGHHWQQAASGTEAVDLICENDFDVVLMDVQMPIQDGLETTAIIRAMSDEKSHVPIIAVTAYVTREDRLRCRTAAMDDYLAKPVNVGELLEKVERWGRTRFDSEMKEHSAEFVEQMQLHDTPNWATHFASSVLRASKDSETTLSSSCGGNDQSQPKFAAALERYGGDVGLLKMQMGFFVDEAPELLRDIRRAIESCDASSLHHNAHRLKGLERTYDDALGAELAAKLEEMGRTENLDEADANFALLASCVERLHARIKDYLAAPTGTTNSEMESN